MYFKPHFSSLFLFMLLSSSTYALEYEDRLPDTITLNPGATEKHDLISSTCDTDPLKGCHFGYNNGNGYNFTYSSIGGGGKLTLTAKPNPTAADMTIHFNNLQVGNNSTLTFNNFSHFKVNGGLNLGTNAITQIRMKDANSTFFLSERGQIRLNAGARLTISGATNQDNISDFTALGSVRVEREAILRINATSIRFNNLLVNKGTTTLTGDVYSLGTRGTSNTPAISTIENYKTLTITGNFTNGGTHNGLSGAGELINYGGTINITGSLTSSGAGGQNSSIQVYGGSLKVAGGITNEKNSTITIGAYQGKMGQIQGNLTNNQGTLKLDLKGVGLGTHTFIKGTVTGLTPTDIADGISGKSEFMNYTNTTTSLTVSKNEDAIRYFLFSLSDNESSIITAIDESLLDPLTSTSNPQTIYTYGDRYYLRSLSRDIESGIKATAIYAAPLGVWSMLQDTTAQLNAHPESYQDYTTRMIPSRDLRSLAFNMAALSKPQFSLTPFVSSASASNLSGVYTGVNLRLSQSAGAHYGQVFFSYAAGNPSQNLTYAQNEFKSHQFLLGVYDRINLGKYEASFLIHYGNSSLNSTRTTEIASSNTNTIPQSDLSQTRPDSVTTIDPSTHANISYGEFGMEGRAYMPTNLSRRLILKPYVGMRYLASNQDAFKETTQTSFAPALSVADFSMHFLQALVGTEGRLYLTSRHFYYGGAQIQYALASTSKVQASLNGQNLTYNLNKDLAYNFYLGGVAPLTPNLSLKLQALYATSTLGFSTLSGSVGLSFAF